MEIALAAGTLIMGAISGGKQRDAYETSAEQTKEMAERNAQRSEAETREDIRQQRDEQLREQGVARAAAGASGALVSSSSHVDYGQGLWDAKQKEIDWTQKAGKSRADIIRREGELGAQTNRAQGDAAWWNTMAGSVGSAGSFL